MSKSCCFTGHRDITRDIIKKIQGPLLKQIEELAERGVTRFYAGGAMGFDLLAEEAVLCARQRYPQVQLILALPYIGHDRAWEVNVRSFYRTQIEPEANEIYYVSERYFHGCMHKRNRYMVDHSNICISYLSRSSGGTKYTVDYCAEKGIPVINFATSTI